MIPALGSALRPRRVRALRRRRSYSSRTSVVAPPAAEEVVDGPPPGIIRGQRGPLDAVVDQVAHRVDHLAVAVLLQPSAPAIQPGRHRHRSTHLGPLRVRHIARMPARPEPRRNRTELVNMAVTL